MSGFRRPVERLAWPIFILLLLIVTTSGSAQAVTGIAEANPSIQQSSEAANQLSEQTAPSTDKPAAGNPSPTIDQTQAQGQDNNSKKNEESKKSGTTQGTSNDRLFFALPNFLTIDKNGNIIPLTASQKFKVVARGAFDPVQIPWYGALAAISQAEDSEPGFGQGAEGYAKRLGTYAADGVIENFMVGAILPSLFRQDPRFFPSGHGSFFHRTGYAVSRIVVTRGDSGSTQFNISEVLGSAISSSISTYSYHPRADRTVGNTASVWLSQMGYDAITNFLKEFWPDLQRKVKKQKH